MNLWSYWENRYSTSKPGYLKLCEQTIERHRGSAQFVIVTPETLSDYVPALPRGFEAMIPAHKSDYLRLRLLNDHGGGWIDLDTVVFADLTGNFLDLLHEAPLVSIGTVFSQALFASVARGAFVAECLQEATRRIEGAGPLEWGSIGSELLLPMAQKHGYRRVPMRAWAFGFKEWQKYLEPGTIDMSNRLICMLYNKMMFEPLKDQSEEDIMDADTRLAWMFRTALA